MKALRAAEWVKAYTSSGLLKDPALQGAQTRLVSGEEARVPEPLHLPSEAATSRKGHRRGGEQRHSVRAGTEQVWRLVGSDRKATEAGLKPLMVPGGHLETHCSKARSRKNGWACMCSRVAVSSGTGISCLAPRRSSDKSPLRLVAWVPGRVCPWLKGPRVQK